tara:strand:- start:361 stop:852 length:492 start_codon:yes stop_codon:yes gene_type:complete
MKLDLILFPDIDYQTVYTVGGDSAFQPKSTGRLTMGLDSDDGIVFSREGSDVLVSTFIKTLLTRIGSCPYQPAEGSPLYDMLNYHNPDTLQEDLSLAIIRVEELLSGRQSSDLDLPDSARLASARLLEVVSPSVGEVRATIQLISGSGEAATFTVPVGVSSDR